MYYYINTAGQQAGPVPANQLASYGVTGETLVWKAGMSQWTKAAQVAELQAIFTPNPQPTFHRPNMATSQPNGYQPQNTGYQPQPNNYQPQNTGYQPQPNSYQPQNMGSQSPNTGMIQRKPDNNMVWAIVCTICCCLPLGVYAIYCAAQVDSSFKSGQYDKAQEWADKAKKWAIWGMVGGFIVQTIYTITNWSQLVG